MELFSTYHLKRWVEQNRELFKPPYKTNRVLAYHKDFIVMILHGPHVKPPSERRQVVKIREGEVFLCPGGLAHSPRRGKDTWGMVIERKRRPEEIEEFVWFCENCDEKVYSQEVVQGDISAQVTRTYGAFNSDPRLRTCTKCSYIFPQTPMAERLGFLETKR
jgi:3-hydroxyanthranilate 3,4-dioxygenase